MKRILLGQISAAALTTAFVLPISPARADVEEIVVTARKREETTLQVPVTLQAFSGETLAKQNIRSFDSVARLTPGLIVGEASGGTVGGSLFLRGIGSGESNTFIDQAIAFNVDGMHLTRAAVRRLGFFDVQRVEILKGPQSLYFGRNSSGGIIALVSADPTPTWDAQIKGGYETEAKEKMTEGYISGPITKNLGMRVAGYMSRMEGWIDNDVVATPNLPVTSTSFSYGSQNPHAPATKEYGGRLTLKYEAPNAPLTVKLKSSYGHQRGAGMTSTGQNVFCPLGRLNIPGAQLDNCAVDHHNILADVGPLFATLDPKYGDGVEFITLNQTLSTAEVAYDLTPSLTLTSISGYFYMDQSILSNSVNSSRPLLGAFSNVTSSEFSQEFRLQSKYDGPVNFMLAGQYNSVQMSYYQTVATLSTALGRPVFLASGTNTGPFLAKQNEDAFSLASQISVDLTKKLTVTGGARWSVDRKGFAVFSVADLRTLWGMAPGQQWALPQSQRTFYNISPEVTLSYRPTDDYNFYASWKSGFKAGGFNAGSGFPWRTQNASYGGEKTEGPEVGLKARITPDLRVDVAGYIYKVSGLQVTQVVGVTQLLTNVGGLWTKGAELNVTYAPSQIQGLRLNGGFAYDHARYQTFLMDCYTGQTAALGCTAGKQRLDGQRALRAPDWAANFGASYEHPIGGSGMMIGLAADATYTSGFFTDVRNIPGSWQGSYIIPNASLRLFREDGGWEFAVIGSNLSNELTFQRSTQVPFTPTAGSGTALADIVGTIGRGRQIMLQVTLKPFDLMHGH